VNISSYFWAPIGTRREACSPLHWTWLRRLRHYEGEKGFEKVVRVDKYEPDALPQLYGGIKGVESVEREELREK